MVQPEFVLDFFQKEQILPLQHKSACAEKPSACPCIGWLWITVQLFVYLKIFTSFSYRGSLLRVRPSRVWRDCLENVSNRLHSKQRELAVKSFQKEMYRFLTRFDQGRLWNGEDRIRHKMGRWKLSIPPGILPRRTCKRLARPSELVGACVLAARLRTLFNGCCTAARFRQSGSCVHTECPLLMIVLSIVGGVPARVT